mgnify:CR=1 FL=1
METYGAHGIGNTVDSIFLTQLQLVADKYHCTIKDIDIKNRIVDLDCPLKMTEECAIELSKIFEKYLY